MRPDTLIDQRRWAWGGVFALVSLGLGPGCETNRQRNTAAELDSDLMPVHTDETLSAHLKAGLVVPLVDVLLAEPVWRGVGGGEAWNVVDGDVPPGSFYAAR